MRDLRAYFAERRLHPSSWKFVERSSAASGGEGGVEFFEQRGQAVLAEQRERAGQAAAAFERAVVEVAGSKRGVRADFLGDELEEGTLLGGRRVSRRRFPAASTQLAKRCRASSGNGASSACWPMAKRTEEMRLCERLTGFGRALRGRRAGGRSISDFRRREVIGAAFHGLRRVRG